MFTKKLREGIQCMRVGISACSDGQLKEWKKQNEELGTILYEQGIEAVFAKHIYVNKTFWGYSDLTTVINAIYTKTGKSSALYQIKNLVYANGELQRKRFAEFISKKNNELFDVNYSFLQGERLEGIVVGGNIRCLLKLAGTEYWPNMDGKILFLEAYGGEVSQIATLFTQLEQMGVFKKVEGIILGTFTAYEKSGATQSVFYLLAGHIPETLPVAKTTEIGHGTDSKAIVIGQNMELRN